MIENGLHTIDSKEFIKISNLYEEYLLREDLLKYYLDKIPGTNLVYIYDDNENVIHRDNIANIIYWNPLIDQIMKLHNPELFI